MPTTFYYDLIVATTFYTLIRRSTLHDIMLIQPQRFYGLPTQSFRHGALFLLTLVFDTLLFTNSYACTGNFCEAFNSLLFCFIPNFYLIFPFLFNHAYISIIPGHISLLHCPMLSRPTQDIPARRLSEPRALIAFTRLTATSLFGKLPAHILGHFVRAVILSCTHYWS